MVAWFSANAFIGTITPVKNGGIPHFAELKLVFKEGGAFEFYTTYTSLLDRIQAIEGDSAAIEHLEDLPTYSNDGAVEASGSLHPPPEEEGGSGDVNDTDELPPAYDDVASDDGRRGRSRTRY
jgi:hypothetical protein